MNKPQRMFNFLAALTKASREFGIVIAGRPELVWQDGARGSYCLNPNNTGPEFSWQIADSGNK